MKIKRIVCLIAAAAMAFSLAACGGGNGGNSGGNEGGGADSGSAADAGEEMDFSGQTLTVANWSDYATDQEYGAAAFEELYNCNVEFYDITSYPEHQPDVHPAVLRRGRHHSDRYQPDLLL